MQPHHAELQLLKHTWCAQVRVIDVCSNGLYHFVAFELDAPVRRPNGNEARGTITALRTSLVINQVKIVVDRCL